MCGIDDEFRFATLPPVELTGHVGQSHQRHQIVEKRLRRQHVYAIWISAVAAAFVGIVSVKLPADTVCEEKVYDPTALSPCVSL